MAHEHNSIMAPGAAETPGTFAGLIPRLNSLVIKAHVVKEHANDIREKIDGSRVPIAAESTSTKPRLQEVTSGFIASIDGELNLLEDALGCADEALEHVWAKVS